MPSKSEKQRRYIFHLRGKYGSKSNTPAKNKWIWDDNWKKIEEMIDSDYHIGMAFVNFVKNKKNDTDLITPTLFPDEIRSDTSNAISENKKMRINYVKLMEKSSGYEHVVLITNASRKSGYLCFFDNAVRADKFADMLDSEDIINKFPNVKWEIYLANDMELLSGVKIIKKFNNPSKNDVMGILGKL